MVDDFRSMYDSLYGHGAGVVSQGIELFTVRVHAVVRLHRPAQAVEKGFEKGPPGPAGSAPARSSGPTGWNASRARSSTARSFATATG